MVPENTQGMRRIHTLRWLREKGGKKKEITCFKFKLVGYDSNEFDENQTVKKSNKKGKNLLVLNDQQQDSSSEEYMVLVTMNWK